MKRYTVGFVFDQGMQNVLLIEKTHPEWQRGKYNGVGGRIEEGESDIECMVREMKEEAGLSIPAEQWREIAMTAVGDSVEVVFFATKYAGVMTDAVTMTEEQVIWFPADRLPEKVISNLRWLIPLCKDTFGKQDTPGDGIAEVQVRYK